LEVRDQSIYLKETYRLARLMVVCASEHHHSYQEIWPYVCAHIQMFGQHPRVLKRKQKEYLAWMMRDTLPAKLVKKPPQAARAAAAGVKRA
jgi:hypothetical protein